jgi:hypothetical protein
VYNALNEKNRQGNANKLCVKKKEFILDPPILVFQISFVPPSSP